MYMCADTGAPYNRNNYDKTMITELCSLAARCFTRVCRSCHREHTYSSGTYRGGSLAAAAPAALPTLLLLL